MTKTKAQMIEEAGFRESRALTGWLDSAPHRMADFDRLIAIVAEEAEKVVLSKLIVEGFDESDEGHGGYNEAIQAAVVAIRERFKQEQ